MTDIHSYMEFAGLIFSGIGAIFAFLAGYWTLKVDDKIKTLQIWVMQNYISKEDLDRMAPLFPHDRSKVA